MVKLWDVNTNNVIIRKNSKDSKETKERKLGRGGPAMALAAPGRRGGASPRVQLKMGLCCLRLPPPPGCASLQEIR